MIRPLRKSLFILLLLLQLIAPLVHAHSCHEPSAGGLHLPGLELLNSEADELFTHAAELHSNPGGVMVSVSSGIEDHQNVEFVLFFVQPVRPFKREFIEKQLIFSDQVTATLPQTSFLPVSPRAPPY